MILISKQQTWYARWNLTKTEKKLDGFCVRGVSPLINKKKPIELYSIKWKFLYQNILHID